MPSIKHENRGRTWPNSSQIRQMTFAKFFVEGVYSNAECARKAGYAEDVAAKQASILLNGRDYPHVLEYVTELARGA
jgi:phage terminase small subunit